MSDELLILRIDAGNTTFQKAFKRLQPTQYKEACKTIGSLVMLDLTRAPAKLHFHPLKNALVPSVLDPTKKVKVYTIHLTADDRYKLSFTIEEQTAYFRSCGEHDDVDKAP